MSSYILKTLSVQGSGCLAKDSMEFRLLKLNIQINLTISNVGFVKRLILSSIGEFLDKTQRCINVDFSFGKSRANTFVWSIDDRCNSADWEFVDL